TDPHTLPVARTAVSNGGFFCRSGIQRCTDVAARGGATRWKTTKQTPRKSRRQVAQARQLCLRVGIPGTIDLGGLDVRYSPNIRKGSNYVELTVIGPSGTFVKEAHTPMHAAAAAALP
ncbi:hypothetical protein, partial [Pandoraea nosoerga]|uniref:hypothetical protein n=1 Tax=Pandoraea nosoerga TaxID=2508296 RepID=UPI003F6835AE